MDSGGCRRRGRLEAQSNDASIGHERLVASDTLHRHSTRCGSHSRHPVLPSRQRASYRTVECLAAWIRCRKPFPTKQGSALAQRHVAVLLAEMLWAVGSHRDRGRSGTAGKGIRSNQDILSGSAASGFSDGSSSQRPGQALAYRGLQHFLDSRLLLRSADPKAGDTVAFFSFPALYLSYVPTQRPATRDPLSHFLSWLPVTRADANAGDGVPVSLSLLAV